MSKKIMYKCDICGEELRIEYSHSDEYEFRDEGWTHDRNTDDTHYCEQCSSDG